MANRDSAAEVRTERGALRRLALFGPGHPFRGGIAYFTHGLADHLDPALSLWLPFERQYPSWAFPGESDRQEGGVLAGQRVADRRWDPWSWSSTETVARAAAAFGAEVALLPWWTWVWAPADRTLLAALRRCGLTKAIAVVHNVADHDGGLLRRTASRLVLDRMDGFHTHSTDMAERLALQFPGRPISVAPLPLHPLPGDRQLAADEARRRLGLAQSAPTFLFFGFIRPYKGLDVLLDAWPDVQRQTGGQLLVVGEAWGGAARLLAQARRLDGVTVHDRFVPDGEAHLWFRAADAVVLPYRAVTGSGIVPIATWFERAIIASALPGLQEVVADRQNGLLVPPEDPTALASAMVCAIEKNLCCQLEEGARRAAGRMSWSRYVGIVSGLVETVAGQGA